MTVQPSRYVYIKLYICWIYPPPRMPVANEGLGWDTGYPTKNVTNPPGGWHPGWGVDPAYIVLL